MQVIIDFFNNNYIARMILDSFFLLIILSFILYLVTKFRKAFNLLIIGVILYAVYAISQLLNLEMSKAFYYPVVVAYVIIVVVLLAPELRKTMEYHKKSDNKMI